MDEGVEVIFGIPGAGILPFYQSLMKSERSDTLSPAMKRARSTPPTAMPGPWGRWASARPPPDRAPATSSPASTRPRSIRFPIIAITGQNVKAQLGKEAFQAVDIAEIVKPVTKKSYCVKESAQVPWVFREAFRIAQEGRPGPVLIDLPLDVQKGEIEYDPAIDSKLEFIKPSPNPKKIRREPSRCCWRRRIRSCSWEEG